MGTHRLAHQYTIPAAVTRMIEGAACLSFFTDAL